MKIQPARADAFARAPAAQVYAVLLYGPDSGLVRERGELLARAVVPEPDDPFRAIELTPADIKADPARLSDEAAAISMTGGRRVVRLRDAPDGLAPVLADYLAKPPCAPGQAALIVIEAGDLSPRSPLRKLFEDAKNAAAVACYLDDTAQLETVIRSALAAENISVTPDALEFLTENLGGDRMVTRRELEKLALFAGTGGRIDLADAAACIGDTSAMAMDAVAFDTAAGDVAGLDKALERVFQEGVTAVGIVRGVMRHFDRLQQAAASVAAGDSEEAAMAALRPAVFWKDKDRFRAQMRRWTDDRAGVALSRLVETEILCKTTGMPDQTVCRQTLFELAQAKPARG